MPIRRRRNLGGDILLSKTVTLNHANILAASAAQATPIYVVQPGVGKIVVPFAATYIVDVTAGVYTNVDSVTANLGFAWAYNPIGFTFSGSGIAIPIGNWMFTDNSVINYAQQTLLGLSDTIGSASTLQEDITNISGIPFVLFIYNGALGAFTGGNAANTLKVTLFYTLVDG